MTSMTDNTQQTNIPQQQIETPNRRNIITRTAHYLLITPKILYLTFSFFFYALHSYRSQFVVQQYGVSKTSFGMYLAIPQLLSFVFGVYIASFNDRAGLQKLILMGVFGSATLLYTTFFYIKNFPLFLVIYTLYFCLVSITLPLLDKVVLEYLDKTPGVDSSNYGTQRMFTPIGYMILTYLMDVLVTNKKSSDGSMTYDFSSLLWYGVITGGIAMITTIFFVENLPRRENVPSNLKSALLLFKNKEYMFFIFLIFLNGITRASMTNYLNVYFDDHYDFNKDDANAADLNWWQTLHNTKKKAFCGIVGNLVELGVYLISPLILQKLGLLMPIFISQIFQLIRFSGYCLITPGYKNAFELALLLETCKGVNFGLIQCSAVNLANRLCQPSLKSVSQIVYTGSFVAMGSVISGFLFTAILSTQKSKGNVIPAGPYKLMFFTDLMITLFVMILMGLKYAYSENLLFNKKNLEKKLDEIEEAGMLEEKAFENKKDKLKEIKEDDVKI